LFCHDPKQIWDEVYHAEKRDVDCIVCHNPHGGEDRNLLR
jgi:hypothetical protein